MTDHSEAPAGIGHNQPPEPTLAERLKQAFTEPEKKIEEIAAKANACPKTIEDDAAKAAATEIAALAGKLAKVLNAMRIEIKAPFKEGVDTVDGFFRDPIDRLDRIDKALMQRVTTYDRAQVAKKREADRLAEQIALQKAEAAKAEAQQAAGAGRMDDALAALEDAATANAAAAEATDASPSAADQTRVRTESGVVASAGTEWTFEVTDRAKIDLNTLRDFIAPDDVDKALKRFVKINKGTKEIAGVRFFEDVKTRRRRS